MNNSKKMVASLQKQDLAHANKYFERALTNDTEEELLELADYLESIGFFPQAKRIYETLAPHYPEAYISLAQIASEDGQVEEAFAYLEEITSDSDWYVTALLVKADLYQMEGLPDVAREKLAEAKQLSDEPLVTFGMAEIDFELGNFNQAIKEYASLDNRMIYEQTGVSTYQRIGVSYASLGKFEVAIEFLEKSLEIEYDDAVAFELATILYDQKEYQKANLYFKQIDTISPEFEGYEYGYALSLHAEHQTEEALRLTQQGLSKNPFDTRLLLLASQLSYELHDERKAEDYLLKAKDNAEDLEEIALRLSNLYLEQERFDEVLKFEEQDIDNVLTKWNIARAYQALEQTTAALERYRLLLSDLKENPEFLEQYIYLLREMGDFEEAKHQAEHYLHLVPDDVEMQELYNSL
ncbi:tetratricopeptide repeat protein [Streptococcus anginosus]|uniref:Tetratricopeptide repeat protein n=2 Tax=Streptococcus TaxID=1301 RepID=A0A412PPW5_STRAP|nr:MULTISPECIES: tetratricopeptide repeat protein [Streptococcus]KAB0646052.1 tetratricopeptide repeat protein [Aerococcus sanguinicola]KAA9230832.1 tetratricopeptide repeat protein [Streptococcus anginosus]KAA9248592.1 tetratricopeptide repeat protein [Streptococcus anginosus]KAA9256053.1 tetratricopeptide repeat protein [Streptococcus anginosus]KAA9261605.1 tetratricopeptide repeat protein [Streptococcus anginosus]